MAAIITARKLTYSYEKGGTPEDQNAADRVNNDNNGVGDVGGEVIHAALRGKDAAGDDIHAALRGVNIEIQHGEFVAVLGHNGSGKSTLARHFNAMLRPSSGVVTVAGFDAADDKNAIEIRRRVGMVFQNPDNQIVASVVEEDVAFAPENLGVEPDEIRRRVDDALKLVGMYEYRTHAPHLLSGGQKQRVAIAGALAMQPECIVFDEPTAMLDPRGREDVINIIRRLRGERGVTVVLITHHMEETIDCDRIFVMSDGEIVKSGAPGEIFSEVELLRSVGLDVPDTVLLMSELNRAGWSLPLDALTVDEAAEAISLALASV
ncbi:MAG: energy-coupling factor transporter ATPase [Oscillospiraceae bacterium]|jgi:energy-coupling factor transport system ATP-binding protein|nr:energy-coupling factor transporter ATPase [Oscillospiraceae bacterium]